MNVMLNWGTKKWLGKSIISYQFENIYIMHCIMYNHTPLVILRFLTYKLVMASTEIYACTLPQRDLMTVMDLQGTNNIT
jgi:hypothetical protein